MVGADVCSMDPSKQLKILHLRDRSCHLSSCSNKPWVEHGRTRPKWWNFRGPATSGTLVCSYTSHRAAPICMYRQGIFTPSNLLLYRTQLRSTSSHFAEIFWRGSLKFESANANAKVWDIKNTCSEIALEVGTVVNWSSCITATESTQTLCASSLAKGDATNLKSLTLHIVS